MFIHLWIFKFWMIRIVSDESHEKLALPLWKVKVNTFDLSKKVIEIIMLSRALGVSWRRK